MPVLQIVATRPLAGKSAIAAGLAQGFKRAGFRVRLARGGDSEAAIEDAASFGALLFATSTGVPIDPGSLGSGAPDEIIIIEVDAGSQSANLPALMVVRQAPTTADNALGASLETRLIGSVATRVAAGEVEAVARELTNNGLRPLALLPEDRTLAAPSVNEIRSALQAQMLYDGENGREVVEDILIGPVYADPARPHFRRFASKAILAPFNKTDLLLAAIETQAACLIITGGRQPSPYVANRAEGEETTVLLAPQETPETVASLGQVWFTSRFRGERKANAVYALLDSRLDFAALARRLTLRTT
jgi:BioD-like phosphotransacetylase family protein